MEQLTSLRLDRWLWCARFYKTRSLAATAVKAGHVRLNGQRAKPGREIQAGDRLTIAKGLLEWEVIVKNIPARRGPAPEAAQSYEETARSVERRRHRAEHRAAAEAARAPTPRRPDKRTRRLIREQQREEC